MVESVLLTVCVDSPRAVARFESGVDNSSHPASR
jgi:hypothetical protein